MATPVLGFTANFTPDDVPLAFETAANNVVGVHTLVLGSKTEANTPLDGLGPRQAATAPPPAVNTRLDSRGDGPPATTSNNGGDSA